jgi:hypothetical protein
LDPDELLSKYIADIATCKLEFDWSAVAEFEVKDFNLVTVKSFIKLYLLDQQEIYRLLGLMVPKANYKSLDLKAKVLTKTYGAIKSSLKVGRFCQQEVDAWLDSPFRTRKPKGNSKCACCNPRPVSALALAVHPTSPTTAPPSASFFPSPVFNGAPTCTGSIGSEAGAVDTILNYDEPVHDLSNPFNFPSSTFETPSTYGTPNAKCSSFNLGTADGFGGDGSSTDIDETNKQKCKLCRGFVYIGNCNFY